MCRCYNEVNLETGFEKKIDKEVDTAEERQEEMAW